MKEIFKTQVLSDSEETAKKLAADLVDYIKVKLSGQKYVFIALSGGNTPQILFRILEQNRLEHPDWSRVHFFWVDERCVPAASGESNFGNADRLLFSRIDIPRENLHPINGSNDPAAEAVRYSNEIKTYLPLKDGAPAFDVILLGMGDDGHTASIFPGQEVAAEASLLCGVSIHPASGQKRITITEKVINNGNEIIFLVAGASKAETLKLISENSNEANLLPAKRIIAHNGHLSWYLDKAAAGLLINPKD